jgi:hypothetical protein
VTSFVGRILVNHSPALVLLSPIRAFRCVSCFLTRFRGLVAFNSYVVLTELEERHVGTDLGHRPSSGEKFYLAPIHPLWSSSLVLELIPEPVWSCVGFNMLCDPKATSRKLMSSLWSSMTMILIIEITELTTIF